MDSIVKYRGSVSSIPSDYKLGYLLILRSFCRRFQEYHVSKMINAGETFQPTTGVYDVAPTRQVYNKIKPITLGNKEIIPSVRVLDSVSAPGTHKTRLKPKKSSNIGLQIYQVSYFYVC